MKFSAPPPPRVLTKTCAVTSSQEVRGGVQGLKASPRCSCLPKDNARRIKRSHPTTVVTGDQPPSQDQSVGQDRREAGWSREPGPSPMPLGENTARSDAQLSCSVTLPVRLYTDAYPRAAVSVHSVSSGPPVVLQTHCLAPERGHVPSLSSHSSRLLAGNHTPSWLEVPRSTTPPLDWVHSQNQTTEPYLLGMHSTPCCYYWEPDKGQVPPLLSLRAKPLTRNCTTQPGEGHRSSIQPLDWVRLQVQPTEPSPSRDSPHPSQLPQQHHFCSWTPSAALPCPS